MLAEFSSGFFWGLGALLAIAVSLVFIFLGVKLGSLCMRMGVFIFRRAEEEEGEKCREE